MTESNAHNGAVSALLLKGGSLYGPDEMGVNDILVVDERIARIAPDIPAKTNLESLEVVDLNGKRVTPGFIDHHTHFLGGGGMAGYRTSPPPLPLSAFTRAGVTTAIGCLGGDVTTRSPLALLSKARALKEEGLSVFLWTGGTTEHPIVTFTGRPKLDMLLIEEVIGIGEVSISELGPSIDSLRERASYLAELAAEAWVAAKMTGKSGTLILQVPSEGRALEPVFEILERTQLPITQFIPSHVNSSPGYLKQAVQFGKMGGVVDVGTTHTPDYGFKHGVDAIAAVNELLTNGVSADNITLSSDAHGGSGWNYLPISSILERFRQLILQEEMEFSQALRLLTSTPARIAGLDDRKGHLRPGHDADLLVWDDSLNLQDVYARGRRMVAAGEPVVLGTWENRGPWAES